MKILHILFIISQQKQNLNINILQVGLMFHLLIGVDGKPRQQEGV
jgi:hypothetical protein